MYLVCVYRTDPYLSLGFIAFVVLSGQWSGGITLNECRGSRSIYLSDPPFFGGGLPRGAKCRTEKLRLLQQELQNALRQIEELTASNRELEDKLVLAGTAKTDAVSTKETVTKCRKVGDSIVLNVGTEYADMVVECFPGIKTEQLHRVID
jgi:hypothetical protein